mgnify:CR=1 FL=1
MQRVRCAKTHPWMCLVFFAFMWSVCGCGGGNQNNQARDGGAGSVQTAAGSIQPTTGSIQPTATAQTPAVAGSTVAAAPRVETMVAGRQSTAGHSAPRLVSEPTAKASTFTAVSPERASPEPAAESGRSRVLVTFVELGSVNCVPCRMMKPVLEEVERKYAGRVQVVFYDVWKPEGRPYAEQYRIRAIPTQVFLDKDGNEFFRHTGYFPLEEIEKVLAQQGVR